jgi:RNA polymerase sigma-70 factor (ECF subfamily)
MAADEPELEALYRARAGAFREAIAAITGSREAAGDVVQDAFAQALVRRRDYRSDGSLEGWVWRIALRQALGSRRRRRWPLLRGDEPIAEAAAASPLDADPELGRAVRALAPRRRLFVFLHYYADLSYAQIAEACDVREGTVAAALAQARAELHAALEGEVIGRG